MKRHIFIVITLAIFIVTGCSPSANFPTLTARPATVTAARKPGPEPSVGAAATLPPLAVATTALKPTPVPVTIDPTYFVFPTDTPTATLDTSLQLLRIVVPGPMSKVVSPIDFVTHIAPDYTGTTWVELIGEDGTELYRKVLKTYSNIGYYTRVDEKVPFEIKGAAEMARLQISTFDSYGRLQAFNSVRLLLLAVGDNNFTPAYPEQDRVLLRYPSRGDEISGSDLPVTGEYQPANDQPLILEIIDTNGNLLGSRELQLAPGDGSYQTFTTDLPYQVTQKTPALLVLRQTDDRMDGMSYLFSMQIVLSP